MVETSVESLPSYESETVKRARDGDIEAAHEIIQETIDAIRCASERHLEPLSREYALYMADALERALKNPAAAGTALGLKGRAAGRRRGSGTHDPVVLAALYWLARRRGWKPAGAKELIVSEVGVDRRGIERAAKKYSVFEDQDPFGEKELIALIAPAWEGPKGRKGRYDKVLKLLGKNTN